MFVARIAEETVTLRMRVPMVAARKELSDVEDGRRGQAVQFVAVFLRRIPLFEPTSSNTTLLLLGFFVMGLSAGKKTSERVE